MTDNLDYNIKSMSTVSPDLLRYVEKHCSGDIHAPKELNSDEQITYLFLGSLGLDLFYDVNTKIEIPEHIKGNLNFETIWRISAKQTHLKKVMRKAKEIFYKIKDQMEKDSNKSFKFEQNKYTQSEVIAGILLARLEGYVINWNELDHSFCDIHTDWTCSFTKGKEAGFVDLRNATLKNCVSCGHFKSSTPMPKVPYEDETVLSIIENNELNK